MNRFQNRVVWAVGSTWLFFVKKTAKLWNFIAHEKPSIVWSILVLAVLYIAVNLYMEVVK